MTDLLAAPALPADDRGADRAPALPPAAPPADPGADPGWVRWVQLVSTIVVVAGCVLYTMAHLAPEWLFRDTTPAGGDFGAHVWGPAYLRDHILPHFRLSGWAPDWYAGFPMYQFYMVVPALAVVLVDVVLPYGVALKLVGIAGVASLPVVSWAFGRLAGLKWPVPQLFAIASVFFLFDETFTIYGGNIASTMAGEFSFSIALSLGMLYLGVFAYGMRTGKHRALAAVLFALCALSHLIVAFFAIIGTLFFWLLWVDRKRTWYLVSMAIPAGLLTMFWILPFWWRGPYMTDMFYERRVDWWPMFFPFSKPVDWLMFGLALVGLIGSVVRGWRAGAWIGIMAIFYGVWARVWPQSHLWNARLLPFMYLMRYFLIALGVFEVGMLVARLIRAGNLRVQRWAQLGTLGVAVLGSLVLLGGPLQSLPGGVLDVRDGAWGYSWGPLRWEKLKFVDDWARWNFSGYENKEGYGEYYGVVSTMKQLGEERGCGRALWENNNEQDKYGTPMALMLLPFWTDGCIGSMEGLFFEAAGTTPYHFLTAAALSDNSSNPVRRLRYENADVAKGVDHLQQLGVRYYLAYNPKVVEQADVEPRLTKVATTGPWHVYEVEGAGQLVTPLTTQPVVVEGVQPKRFPLTGTQAARDRWLEVGTSWFQDPSAWAALPADDGPADWQRIAVARTSAEATDDRNLAVVAPADATPIQAQELPPVTVSNVETGDDSISFSVDQVGVPVLVKASYFPNWEAKGAEGPYRVAPNLMVVVPTSNDVTLTYGRTPIDLFAYGLSFLGLVGVVLLWRAGPVEYGDRKRRRGAVAEPPVLAPLPSGVRIAEPESLLLDWDDPEPEPDAELRWAADDADAPTDSPDPGWDDAGAELGFDGGDDGPDADEPVVDEPIADVADPGPGGGAEARWDPPDRPEAAPPAAADPGAAAPGPWAPPRRDPDPPG